MKIYKFFITISFIALLNIYCCGSKLKDNEFFFNINGFDFNNKEYFDNNSIYLKKNIFIIKNILRNENFSTLSQTNISYALLNGKKFYYDYFISQIKLIEELKVFAKENFKYIKRSFEYNSISKII